VISRCCTNAEVVLRDGETGANVLVDDVIVEVTDFAADLDECRLAAETGQVGADAAVGHVGQLQRAYKNVRCATASYLLLGLPPIDIGYRRLPRQCDNYNRNSDRRCTNMSRMNLSGYVGHVTIFS